MNGLWFSLAFSFTGILLSPYSNPVALVFYSYSIIRMTSISIVRDLYVEVFFESAPELIHRPDLKATLNHYAFFHASMAITSGSTSCSKCSHEGFTAPPPGYAIGVRAAASPKAKPTLLSPNDQLRLFNRFQNPISDTLLRSLEAKEDEG
jgi:hypothetical protein